jgi:benzoate-CoA ligase family protein
MREPFNASEWLVDRHVDAGDGDRIAIRSGGRTFTYSDVKGHVEQAAGALRALGVRPEERVAMVMLDSVEFVAIFLGAMRIGAVPVPVNPLLPGRDLGVIVADSRARVVAISDERRSVLDELRSGAPEVEQVITTGDVGTDVIGWMNFVGGATDGSAWATWAESPGFWLCTSGSTGQPKLAMHRHGDIPATCATYADQVLGIGSGDRCFSVGPMFHAYGLGNSLTFPFSVGASTVLEPTRPPTPQLVAEVVKFERPTLFFCIPTFYAALLSTDLDADTFASVRCGVSAAEPLPAATFERFRERFGVTILDGIGSTELLHIYTSNTPDKVAGGTSGVPVPGYDVRIVDEFDADQADGAPGQLMVRGPSMATGYWCRSETTRATFEGSWMRTGDLYERDSDGFHTYLGRLDDMLRVGGEWVSPAEVEGVLIEHDDVLEAAVVGERDGGGATRPVAYVVASGSTGPDLDDLIEFCRERLAGFKRPRRYEFVDGLPKTATGKIQRFKLRTANPRP